MKKAYSGLEYLQVYWVWQIFCFVRIVLGNEPVQSISVYHIDQWRSSKRDFDKGMHKRFQQQMLNATIFVCLVRDFHG